MVKNLKRTFALMLSIIMIFSSTLTAFASDEGIATSNEAETSAQIEETVAAEEEPSTEAPKAETATEAEQKEEAAPAQKAPEKPQAFDVELKDVAAYFGEDATFTIKTDGEVRSCQWQMSKDNGRRWSNLSKRQYGSSESLVIKADQKNNGRMFRCEVTFKNGAKALSDAARLKAEKAPTFPAVKFDSEKVEGVTVHVDAPEGAFPEGTTMDVAKVKLDAVQDVVDTTKSVEGKVVAAVDITFFDANGKEIEPNAPIKVEMASKEIAKVENPTVIHVDTNADQIEEADVEAEEVEASTIDNVVKFDADQFTIYAVVDPGEDGDYARASVNFWGWENKGTDENPDYQPKLITTYYIKNSDDADHMKKIVTDPGAGDLDEGQLFYGWSVDDVLRPNDDKPRPAEPYDQNNEGEYHYVNDTTTYVGADYTSSTKKLTIEGVREYLLDEVIGEDHNGIKEGDAVNIYAMIFKYYDVTYFGDDAGISMGTDTVYLRPNETSAPYTVSMAYTADDTQYFKGWKPTDATKGNISPAKEFYENETEVTLTGSVVFNVEAPHGAWLIYNGNGKGATYNAPQFYLAGEPTVPAVNATDDNMKRYGYQFRGWYYGKEETYTDDEGETQTRWVIDESRPFTFGGTISENTNIFAKWEANEKAPYTVIFWTQNQDRSGYDLKASYSGEGDVGTNIPVTFVDNNDADYVTGEWAANTGYGRYTGFCVKESDANQQIEITPTGDAVINLHFDRIQYNVRFYYYRERTGGTPYSYAENSARYDGDGVYGVASWSGWGNNRPSQTYGADQTATVENYTAHYFVLSAYYGEDISSRWPRYDQITGPQSGRGYSPVSFIMMNGTGLKKQENPQGTGTASGSDTVKGLITTMDEMILGKPDQANANFFVIRFNNYYDWRYHVWFEAAPGQDMTGKTTHIYNGKTYYEETVITVRSSNVRFAEQNEPQYPGFDFVAGLNDTWSQNDRWTEHIGQGTDARLNYEYHVNYVYDRQLFNIAYMDGKYIDGDGNQIQTRAGELLEQNNEQIEQGAIIPDTYRNYVPELPPGEEGYVFEGWYVDEACQQPYTWSTMPVGGITVHAKWRQIEYRVFLHPNAFTDKEQTVKDQTLEWGSDEVSTSFRVGYGEKVSLPTGKRTGYELKGWYKDPNFSVLYSEGTELNEETVTTAYDKSESTERDQWGVPESSENKDVSRPWITKKLDIYAKWRQTIEGAEGIKVIYSEEPLGKPGTAPEDPLLYLDDAGAIAQDASEPNDPATYQFLYWVVQKWDGNNYVDATDDNGELITCSPGEAFTVLKSYAKVTDLDEDDPAYVEDSVYKSYTMQLRAEYGLKDMPKDTYFNYYRNFDENDTAVTGLLKNEKDLQINEGRTIYTLLPEGNPVGIPKRFGYKFLGWARDTEHRVLEDGTVDKNAIPYHNYSDPEGEDYTSPEEALYIKWIEATPATETSEAVDGHYAIKDKEGNWTVTVTEAAADEFMPYQAFYAVWEIDYFYVYHTGKDTKQLEAIPMDKLVDGKFDLTSKVDKQKDLYGGYYASYGGVQKANVDAVKDTAKKANDLLATVDGSVKYNGSAISTKVDGKPVRLWVKEDAAKVVRADVNEETGEKEDALVAAGKGTEVTPEAGDVFYLKEVPKDFLTTYLQYVYDWSNNYELDNLYFITTTDDNLYTGVGFEITVDPDAMTKHEVTLSAKFVINRRYDNTSTTIKPADVNAALTRGYVGVVDTGKTYINKNTKFTADPYWETLDGVTVHGTKQAYQFSDGTTKDNLSKAN